MLCIFGLDLTERPDFLLSFRCHLNLDGDDSVRKSQLNTEFPHGAIVATAIDDSWSMFAPFRYLMSFRCMCAEKRISDPGHFSSSLTTTGLEREIVIWAVYDLCISSSQGIGPKSKSLRMWREATSPVTPSVAQAVSTAKLCFRLCFSLLGSTADHGIPNHLSG
jgi:hypothetical protein